MKRLDYTKVSVKLKKSEWRDEWFIYLEAYPGGLLLPLYGINDEASEPLLVE
jgi:hypothetical protein